MVFSPLSRAPRWLQQQPLALLRSLRWLTADTTDGLFTGCLLPAGLWDLDTSIDPDDRVWFRRRGVRDRAFPCGDRTGPPFGCLFCGFFNGLRQVLGSVQTDAQGFMVGTEGIHQKGIPSVALAALIVGGLYSGAFTPTEASAVGFVAAILITAFWLRRLTWEAFWKAVRESAVTTTAILIIIAAAKVFGKALALYRVPQDISAFIAMNIDGPIIFILIVSAVLLVMGLVFETLSMILIMTPVLLPAAMGLGFDPIWFGIYMVIMVECALITPPVGLNLYVIQSVAKVSLGEVASGVWPFLIMMLICVFVLFIWPDLALYIPFKW